MARRGQRQAAALPEGRDRDGRLGGDPFDPRARRRAPTFCHTPHYYCSGTLSVCWAVTHPRGEWGRRRAVTYHTRARRASTFAAVTSECEWSSERGPSGPSAPHCLKRMTWSSRPSTGAVPHVMMMMMMMMMTTMMTTTMWSSSTGAVPHERDALQPHPAAAARHRDRRGAHRPRDGAGEKKREEEEE